jgi:hypothetical protein
VLNQLEKKLLILPGERGNVLYFLFFFMLVSAGMAIGRGTADALFLKRLGIEYLPLMYIIQSMLLAAVSLVYAAFADRIPAEKFFRALFAVLIVLVLGSWFAMSASTVTLIYPAYYLVYEVTSEVLLVHTAFYMHQNMNTLQAKRLTPLIYAGAQIGTISGGLLLVVTTPVFGTQNLLLLWCGLLVAGAVIIIVRHKRHGTSTHFRAPRKSQNFLKDSVEQVHQGIKFTYRSSLLRASSLALFFMVLSFYILCYSANRIYTQTFDTEESLTRFFGLLTATTSTIALFLQLFVTNRAIVHFGVRTINLLFPWTTVVCLTLLTFSFSLPSAIIGSFNKDALMPAFRNPVRSMFFNVLPGYMQGRARAMSIALVLPLALLLCGVLLIVLQRLDNPIYYLVPGICAASLYLFSCRLMNKAYVSTLIATLKERLFLPDKRMYADLQGCSDETLDEVMHGIKHPDAEVAVAFARILTASFPEQAVAIILQRAANLDNATADRFLKLLATLELSGHAEALRQLAVQGDSHLQTTVTRLLLDQGDTRTIAAAVDLLDSHNFRLQAIAIHATLKFSADDSRRQQALATWQTLLAADNAARLASMDIIPDLARLSSPERQTLLTGYLQAFACLLADPADPTRVRSLQGLHQWQHPVTPEIDAAVSRALSSDNPELRIAAAGCLQLTAVEQRDELLLQALGDGHALVRAAAIETLRTVAESYEDLALEWIALDRGSLRAQQTLLMSLLDAGLPEVVFENIVRSKAAAALQLQEAASILEQDTGVDGNAARSLLRYTIREQLEQTIELALMALEPLYESGTIGIIRAGFSSGDARHVANACEVLGNLDKQYMIGPLSDALQRSTSGDFNEQHMTFRGADDVMNWCAQHSNSWLRLCGEQALGNGSGAEHA